MAVPVVVAMVVVVALAFIMVVVLGLNEPLPFFIFFIFFLVYGNKTRLFARSVAMIVTMIVSVIMSMIPMVVPAASFTAMKYADHDKVASKTENGCVEHDISVESVGRVDDSEDSKVEQHETEKDDEDHVEESAEHFSSVVSEGESLGGAFFGDEDGADRDDKASKIGKEMERV